MEAENIFRNFVWQEMIYVLVIICGRDCGHQGSQRYFLIFVAAVIWM